MPVGSTKTNKALAYTQEIDGSPAVFVDGFIYEGFGMYLARYVYDLWTVTGRAVKLFISSDGGLLAEGTTFYDFVRAKGIEGSVEIYGKAGSTATVFGAAFGAANTSISESSEYFIHRAHYMEQDECGDYYRIDATPETQADLDRTNAMLVNIYVQLTGKTAEEIIALLDEGDKGNSMTAEQAVERGFCGQIIEPVKSNIAAFKPKAEKTSTMAEKAKTTVPVKLNLGERVAAAFGGQVTAEIEVDKVVADQLKEKDETIDALKKQIETLESSKAPETPAAEGGEQEKTEEPAKVEEPAEVMALRADVAKHAQRVKELEAELAKPLAKPIVGDNKSAAVGAAPGTEAESPNVLALRKELAQVGAFAKADKP